MFEYCPTVLSMDIVDGIISVALMRAVDEINEHLKIEELTADKEKVRWEDFAC